MTGNPPQVKQTGQLLQNLLIFGRLLRGLGMDINPGRMIDLVQALDLIEIGRKEDFYHAMRSLLVHKHEDIPLFDQAFELFWRKPVEQWSDLNINRLLDKKREDIDIIPPPLQQPEEALNKEQAGEDSEAEERVVVEITQTYSTREVLRHKDFADLTAREIEAVKNMMQQLTLRLGERRTRRKRPGNGPGIDLRRTLRKSYGYGGEVLVWSRRELRATGHARWWSLPTSAARWNATPACCCTLFMGWPNPSTSLSKRSSSAPA